ncbi:MAG: hypothetical protein GX352_00260 [Clostridiales bacterium]|nr:hypothetical protein [Clostridiales bacterium]
MDDIFILPYSLYDLSFFRVIENAMRGYHIQFDFAKEIDRTEEYIRHIEESFRANDGKDT